MLRSECLNDKSVQSPQSPGSHSLKTTSTGSYTNQIKPGSSKGSKSTSLPPPMEFRDPPRATNQVKIDKIVKRVLHPVLCIHFIHAAPDPGSAIKNRSGSWIRH